MTPSLTQYSLMHLPWWEITWMREEQIMKTWTPRQGFSSERSATSPLSYIFDEWSNEKHLLNLETRKGIPPLQFSKSRQEREFLTPQAFRWDRDNFTFISIVWSLLAPSGALIAIPTYYWSTSSTTTPLFQITPVLNTGLSLSEPLYKGYNAL